MQDILLEKFFEMPRWLSALDRGIAKDIRKDQLYQLTKPEVRANMYAAIRDHKYRIAPPHAALIPKDTPGEFRTVFVNEPADRIILSIANDLLFEMCPDMIHPSCKSYLKGVGCGQVVQQVSKIIVESAENIIGWKSDLSKFFDTVPIRYIDKTFNEVEKRTGPSALLDLIRDYYHSDIYFDTEGNLTSAYQSLKQGCAVAAFLADAVLYDVDKGMCELFEGFYRRYSDDMIYLGDDHEDAKQYLEKQLSAKDMKLNPKKVEPISKDRWVRFLGFSIRGADITLSGPRIKTFQKEIENRTIRQRNTTPQRAVNAVNKYLYKGIDGHCWATQVLPVVNVKKDIDTLNAFVLDCLRATATGKRRLGGLGYVQGLDEGCILRGRGRNVSSNRSKTPARVEGYLSLGCMRNALLTRRAVYNTLAASL